MLLLYALQTLVFDVSNCFLFLSPHGFFDAYFIFISYVSLVLIYARFSPDGW